MQVEALSHHRTPDYAVITYRLTRHPLQKRPPRPSPHAYPQYHRVRTVTGNGTNPPDHPQHPDDYAVITEPHTRHPACTSLDGQRVQQQTPVTAAHYMSAATCPMHTAVSTEAGQTDTDVAQDTCTSSGRGAESRGTGQRCSGTSRAHLLPDKVRIELRILCCTLCHPASPTGEHRRDCAHCHRRQALTLGPDDVVARKRQPGKRFA